MRTLGLAGKKYCGKDTAAEVLVEKGWVRIAFADALREMLYTLNPVVSTDGHFGTRVVRWQEAYDEVGYDVLKTWPEARRLMQVFGTEVIRAQVGPDTWVRIAERKVAGISAMLNPPVGVVFTDVRFDNEADFVHRLDGVVIEIVREGHDRDQHGADHVSEAGLSSGNVDIRVENDGTIAELHETMATFA